MTSLIVLIVALFFGFFLYSTPVSEPAAPVDATAIAVTDESGLTEPLTVDGEAAVRLALSTPDADVAYVATASGLYLLEGDNDWTRVGDAPPDGRIVFAADDPHVLMVGETESCAQGLGGSALHTSTDGGSTWTESPDGSLVEPLAIWSDSQIVAGASCAGLQVSDDLGETWQQVNDDLLGLEVTAFAAVAGAEHTILAGLTGEGGTSRLFQFDLADPASWPTAEPMAEYYGLAGLAGYEDKIILASITGVSWTVDDGASWTVDRFGLEDVTLEDDPATEGLPPDVDPSGYGLFSIYLDDRQPLLVGSASDIYEYWNTDVRPSDTAEWELLASPGMRVEAFMTAVAGDSVLAQTEVGVWIVVPGPWTS
jgi:hypothetical protein